MKTLFALSIAAASVLAHAAIIDFENLPNSDPSYTLHGDTITSGGFQFASVLHGGDAAAIATWGSSEGFYTGSTAIFANFFDDSLDMTMVGGGAFSLTSIDLADVFLGASFDTITFTGTRADLSTVTETIILNDGSSLSTYSLSLMSNVIKININDSTSNDLQIDNLVVDAVPEPATMAVLGLGAAALMRRRRK